MLTLSSESRHVTTNFLHCSTYYCQVLPSYRRDCPMTKQLTQRPLHVTRPIVLLRYHDLGVHSGFDADHCRLIALLELNRVPVIIDMCFGA